MLEITLSAALLAGLLSFFSPCILPIVPGYLGYLGSLGNSAGNHYNDKHSGISNRAFDVGLALTSVFFVAGFVSVFMIFGASASALSQLLARHLDWFQKLAGLLIMFFGLHYTGLIGFDFLNREAKYLPRFTKGGPVGGYLVGLAFGFGWTPCVGPVLATIFLVISGSKAEQPGMLLLFTYALGIGVPFILTALFTDLFMARFRQLRLVMPAAKLILGGIMILTGFGMITGLLSRAGYWLLERFSGFAALG